jgi:hypothetical protein
LSAVITPSLADIPSWNANIDEEDSVSMLVATPTLTSNSVRELTLDTTNEPLYLPFVAPVTLIL